MRTGQLLRRAAHAATACAILFAAGCATARDAELRGDESGLAAEVRAALATDSRLAGVTRVVANERRGRVTLAGHVATPEARAAAGRLASSVEGVRLVYNVLVLDRRAAPGARATSAALGAPRAP